MWEDGHSDRAGGRWTVIGLVDLDTGGVQYTVHYCPHDRWATTGTSASLLPHVARDSWKNHVCMEVYVGNLLDLLCLCGLYKSFFIPLSQSF